MVRELGSKKTGALLVFMIILVIIGILAACSNPTSNKTSIETKQLEAKAILTQIYKMELAYQGQNGFYWITGEAASASNPDAFATLAITIMANARYTYTIVSPDAGYTAFTAVATSGVLDDDPTVDAWYITQLGNLVVTSDDAAF